MQLVQELEVEARCQRLDLAEQRLELVAGPVRIERSLILVLLCCQAQIRTVHNELGAVRRIARQPVLRSGGPTYRERARLFGRRFLGHSQEQLLQLISFRHSLAHDTGCERRYVRGHQDKRSLLRRRHDGMGMGVAREPRTVLAPIARDSGGTRAQPRCSCAAAMSDLFDALSFGTPVRGHGANGQPERHRSLSPSPRSRVAWQGSQPSSSPREWANLALELAPPVPEERAGGSASTDPVAAVPSSPSRIRASRARRRSRVSAAVPPYAYNMCAVPLSCSHAANTGPAVPAAKRARPHGMERVQSDPVTPHARRPRRDTHPSSSSTDSTPTATGSSTARGKSQDASTPRAVSRTDAVEQRDSVGRPQQAPRRDASADPAQTDATPVAPARPDDAAAAVVPSSDDSFGRILEDDFPIDAAALEEVAAQQGW